MMGAKEDLGMLLQPPRKFSGKRCLSPAKPNLCENRRSTKRKTNNPVLILRQNNHTPVDSPAPMAPAFMCSSSRPVPAYRLDPDLSKPALGYRLEPDLSPDSDLNASFQETLTSSVTQTENEIPTDILGSFNSVESTSIPWLSSQSSVSRRESGVSYFSSSYTSWTKPEAGNRVSDSCVPNSSILDKDDSIKPFNRSRSLRRSKKSSGRCLKRDSSADTSKDIDDLEDFELDGGLDELLHDDDEDPFDEAGEKKRSSTLMESPDLAYGSMNPSADELSK